MSSIKKFPRLWTAPCAAIAVILLLFSCKHNPIQQLAGISGETRKEVYDGIPKPYVIEGENYTIRYYASMNELADEKNGEIEAPVEPGNYFVRVEHISLPENYAAAMLIIDKARIEIFAEKFQEVRYDGMQKRVLAQSNPSVQLSYSYYPTEEIRREAALGFTQGRQKQAMIQGFKRVERAPVEPGIYYVLVYYAGDDHYHPAIIEVDFTITRKSQ